MEATNRREEEEDAAIIRTGLLDRVINETTQDYHMTSHTHSAPAIPANSSLKDSIFSLVDLVLSHGQVVS